MTGNDYTATTTLTDADGEVIAETGARCDAVPSESLPWLIEQGVIVPATTSATMAVRDDEPSDEDTPPDGPAEANDDDENEGI